jgi:predicted transcriptional regulator
MFSDMLRRDRERMGYSVGQTAWRFGVSLKEYRELKVGTCWLSFDTYDRICKLFGWPQAFIVGGRTIYK